MASNLQRKWIFTIESCSYTKIIRAPAGETHITEVDMNISFGNINNIWNVNAQLSIAHFMESRKYSETVKPTSRENGRHKRLNQEQQPSLHWILLKFDNQESGTEKGLNNIKCQNRVRCLGGIVNTIVIFQTSSKNIMEYNKIELDGKTNVSRKDTRILREI